ncbi:MAG: diguanylate cyclase [Bacteriovoracaceae bacterium]|nr:diguanylate cyclase [Bacteriovoracaceae bacterium]
MSQNRPVGKILLIEDESQIQKLVTDALQMDGHTVQSVMSGEKALELIPNFMPHLIMLDYNLPGMNGIEVLHRIRQMDHYIAVIFVSAQNKISDMIKTLDAGADDYISKPFILGDLLARVRSQLRLKHLNDALAFANKKLEALVDIDDLTGLYNMRSTYKRIEHELKQAEKFKLSLGIIMMDMDHFKTVNDNHDHLFGSFVLSEVGKIIKESIRFVDYGVRYGGDEFMLIITETDEKSLQLIAERIRTKIEKYLFTSGADQMHLTCSLGYALTQPGNAILDSKQLVKVADNALYESKNLGRNRVHGFTQKDHPQKFNQ